MSSGLYSGTSGLALGTGLYKGVSSLWGGASGLVDGFGGEFSPASLFAAGEQGAWYDPSDLSTLFQDSAGTTPVTAAGQPVGRMVDKSGRGNHATQATAAARPTLGRVPATGRRNLLTQTEEFDNALWVKTNTSVVANNATAPNGTLTADTVTSNAVNSRIGQFVAFAAVMYRFSIWLRRVSGTGVVEGTLNNFTYTQFSLTSTWQRFSFSYTYPVADNNEFQIRFGSSGDVIEMWGAQLEFGNTTTDYQRVGTTFDVTEAGVADLYYLSFDGVDDSMATANIDFSATDEMTVIAGVRKLSDAATAMLVELSVTSSSNNGTFAIFAPNAGATYTWRSRGTAPTLTVTPASYAAPITNVVTGLGDISADQSIIRVNGTEVASESVDQGTGNFGNYPLYIGRRGGTTLPLSGYDFGLIIRGKTTSGADLTNAEVYMAAKSGVTI